MKTTLFKALVCLLSFLLLLSEYQVTAKNKPAQVMETHSFPSGI